MEIYNIEIKYRHNDPLGVFRENPIKTTSVSVPGINKEDALKKFKEHFSFGGLEILEVNCGILGMETENLWVKPTFGSKEFYEQEIKRLKEMLFSKD